MGTRGENSVLFFPLNLLINITSARPGKLYSIPCADSESLKPNAITLYRGATKLDKPQMSSGHSNAIALSLG